jgi:four helix bundle protein
VDKPHKKLEVWKKSMEMVLEVYQITKGFPGEEKYGLISQIRRAAVSVPSNIAEGAARNTKREFINYLHTAQGSLSELDTQLELSLGVGYMTSESLKPIQDLIQSIDKMLTGLIKSLRRTTYSERT